MMPDSEKTAEPFSVGPNREHLGKQVMHGIKWSSALYFSQTLLQVGSIAALARLLSPREYGVVAAANVLIQFALTFMDMGLGNTIVQIPDLTPKRIRAAYALIMTSAVMCFIVTFLCGPLVALWFKMPELTNVVRALSFIFIILAFSALSQNILFRQLRSKEVYTAQLIAFAISNVFITIPLAFFGFSYWSLVYGTLGQVLINTVMLRWFLRTAMTPQFSWQETKTLMRTAVGFSSSGIFYFISTQVDQIVVGRFSGRSSLGLYSRAYALMSLPNTMYASIVERVVFPAMSRVQNELPRLRAAYLRGVSLTAFFGIPLMAFIIVAAPEIIYALFGEKWVGAIQPFTILGAAIYCRVANRVSATIPRCLGRIKQFVFVNALQALLITGGCLAVCNLGINAIAAVVCLTNVLVYLLNAFIAGQSLNVTMMAYFKCQARGAALGCLVALCGYGVAVWCHTVQLPHLVALIAIGLVSVVTTLAAALLAPRYFAGADVEDLLKKTLVSVKAKWKERTNNISAEKIGGR